MQSENATRSVSVAPDELGLPAPLRPYQWQGVSFLVRSDAALLADEMGLGKTVQAAIALRLVLQLPGCDRALVVAPSSLRLNWERELGTWAPNVAARRVQGSAADRDALYRLPIPVLIASYEQIRTDGQSLDSAPRFDVVVLDEAQRIKNSESATAVACQRVTRARAWALTGTPVENHPDDLFSIFRFLKPGLLRPFLARIAVHERIQPHFLRRTKEEVLGDLPPIIEQDLLLELQGAQRDAYDALWDSRRTILRASGVPVSEVNLLALITRLKQLCNFDPSSGESAKLESLLLLFEGLSEPTDKVIVFSQYVETLKWLSERLGDIRYDLFHGGLREPARDLVVRRFQNEPGPRVLLMSLRAGGVGLNLQAASAVVLFDRWWNPAVEDQAVQRAHRFGRTRPLHAIRFLVADSIEQRIAEVLRDKQVLFEHYIEQAESANVHQLSRTELRRILALTAADVDQESSD